MNWSSQWQQPIQVAPIPVEPIPPHILERLRNANLKPDRDGLLMLWQWDNTALAKLKEQEMELRKLCAKWLVPKPEKEGVNNVDLGQGYTAKVGIKLNYNLDATNDQIEDVQKRIEQCGNDGKFLADRLITWEAKLSVSEYKKLMEDAKSLAGAKTILDIVNAVIVTKDGAPTLEIKEPKVSKK